MKGRFLLLCCLICLKIFAQNDTTGNPTVSKETNKKKWPGDESAIRIFYGQRLINAKTVEILPKGAMAFTIVHTFGNIAAKDANGNSDGGTYTFFGLDEISDAQIGFQIGVGNRLNILLQHTVGSDKGGAPRHYWEGGLKYQFLRQASNGSPISLTAFGNIVSCAERVAQDDSLENSFVTDADRLSELFQLMAARRFGNVSLQISGTYLHTHLVIPGDQNDLFSIGGAVRLPLTKSVFIIADYFHSFRTQESIDAWKDYQAQRTPHTNQTPRDVFGIGVEILTAGHVFHLNFTNARNILENRFLPRTTDQWSEGEFRWGFTLARNFMVFNKK